MPDEWPNKGDLIGNDVWIGYEATIMPGIRVGDGAMLLQSQSLHGMFTLLLVAILPKTSVYVSRHLSFRNFW